VAPTTGDRFLLALPYRNAEPFQLFVDAFGQADPDSLHSWLLDNRGAHTTQRLRWPENVRCVWLPPYGPELNPIERGWRDRNDHLAWQQFPHVEAQQDTVSELLRAYTPPTLQALTGCPSLVEVMNALCPS
jgi:hypothetical protein